MNASASNTVPEIITQSPNVAYTPEYITSQYVYRDAKVSKKENGSLVVEPTETQYEFRVSRKVPKLGLMLVGWGGNNGSTLTAAVMANREGVTWRTKEGVQHPNYVGSMTQSSTVRLGTEVESGKEATVPFSAVLPMVHPNDIVIGGWDISKANIGEAMQRAKVLDWDLQRQLFDKLKNLQPLPSVYYPDYIAANQEGRADNVLSGTKNDHLQTIRKDIRDFKRTNGLESVVVLWTANTERFSEIISGVNDTADGLLQAIKASHPEVAPSTVFAVAALLEKCPFINGSPQNTLVPGVIELAERQAVFVGGDDFKSGQTKLKSVLVDFLVSAGIKPVSITSYNHLGNNDGMNLSAPQQFRSKEVSKSNVVDDMVAANGILYKNGDKPDHIVVIKYCPQVGDSKRAMDEYVSDIFMNGKNTLSIYNVCEDSLLASPLILDLTILTELFCRIQYRTAEGDFKPFHPVLSVLSYMLKAPVVPRGTPVINALAKQRAALENILRACIGLAPQSDMALEHKCI